MLPTKKSLGFPVAKQKGVREEERSLSLTEEGSRVSLLPRRRSLVEDSLSRAFTSCLLSSGSVRPQLWSSLGLEAQLQLPAETNEGEHQSEGGCQMERSVMKEGKVTVTVLAPSSSSFLSHLLMEGER